MPEYLAPGVYVEETSYRSKTIEGVSTSTAGFVGPARFGPTKGEPELLTGFADFERIYGGLDQLDHSGTKFHNFLAHGVRAFFEEGGKRLYVSRVDNGAQTASRAIPDGESPPPITLEARYPGAAGNFTVTFTFRLGNNILNTDVTVPELRGAANYDLVWVLDSASPVTSPPGDGELYWLERYFEEDHSRWTFQLRQGDPGSTESPAMLVSALPDTTEVRILTVNVTCGKLGKYCGEFTRENLTFHPEHKNSLTKVFAEEPTNRATELFVPLIFSTELDNGTEIAENLLGELDDPTASPAVVWSDILNNEDATTAQLTFQVLLEDGTDGSRPEASDYEGDEDSNGLKSGLEAFEDLEDISIVAAPGFSFEYDNGYKSDADTILRHLISHCERMRYRIAVLDSANKHLVSSVRTYRGKLDSKYAALYYPWITILDPITEEEVNMPPSGFVAGIYARNDVEYGVHKAPANEVVRLAINFETLVSKAQQEVLNPDGVNCFRFFEGRGYRLWGARTITSDPEWKYVNLRRYFAYLERSIEKHTQWVVFENNSTPLWNNVRSTVEDFLFNEWKSNHLMGDDPKEAYFVRCDRSTMTQNDIDNGRLICLIGVAPVRPAEFVIFRIGQWTADRSQ